MAFDKTKIHLVPPSITDITNQLNEGNLNNTQKDFLLQRLEVIRDYAATVIERYNLKKAA